MGNVIELPQAVEFYRPAMERPFTRPLFSCLIPAGFPSPADDHIERDLDLHELLIDHPAATYYVRMTGDSMIGVGLFHRDILVVDRAKEARHRSLVVAALDGDFTVKRLWKQSGIIELRPENPRYQPIKIDPEQDFVVWGVVVGSVRKFED